ncbi:MAG: hypothetical protein A2792_12050 [Sphingomonadales bacterium RIFCSPHIGHO2_01_FULL_65_20]|nr:MAG: hypothetical protein A2792_12050 [Sphingomonadales bacterium RIFCSPHIGHO2_01_FULL_65_20]
MAEQMTPEEWCERYATLTSAEPWPDGLADTRAYWLRSAERLIADGVTPEQVAAVVLEQERLWLQGDPSSTVRPVGLIRAAR